MGNSSAEHVSRTEKWDGLWIRGKIWEPAVSVICARSQNRFMEKGAAA